MFHQRSQHSGEFAEAYIPSLHQMAEYCDFGTAKDDCIRNRLVIGVCDKRLSKCLQLKGELTLAESLKIVRQSQIIQDQLSTQNGSIQRGSKINVQPREKSGNVLCAD